MVTVATRKRVRVMEADQQQVVEERPNEVVEEQSEADTSVGKVTVINDDGEEVEVNDEGDYEDVDEEEGEEEDGDVEVVTTAEITIEETKTTRVTFEVDLDSMIQEIEDAEEEEEEEGEAQIIDEEAEEEAVANESILDRIIALRDIVPVGRRRTLSRKVDQVVAKGTGVTKLVGRLAWILATTAILVMLPLGIEIERDNMLASYEDEQKMQMQAQQMLQPAKIDPNVFGSPNFAQPASA